MKTAEEILDKHLNARDICCDRESGYIDDYGVYPIIENAMEEYANQSKWISVEDLHPKVGERVLVLGWSNTDYRYDSSVYNNDNEANQYIVVWDGKNSTTVAAIDDGAFCGNYQYICIDNITHWMKLPEKP